MTSPDATASTRPDGRATRWAEHRLARRAELVEATLRAVRRHGASVGMDDIAAEAGTSKSVLYRHFGDKAGLYLAVVESVDRLIARDLDRALTTVAADDQPDALIAHPEQVIEAAVDSYLTLVEKDPEVYRFVVTHPLLDRPMGDDPLTGLTSRIGDQLAALITAALAASGREAAAAGALAHGVVGLVRAAADHWLTAAAPLPRHDLTRQLSALIAGGLTAVLSPQEQP
ncbi:MAG TPA: TetR/AcrR family transcriptional regulator [Angustibacter sp.]|nr:TetR/AcrR family transcriptional regulator [Angustibacter sp.]